MQPKTQGLSACMNWYTVRTVLAILDMNLLHQALTAFRRTVVSTLNESNHLQRRYPLQVLL